MVSIFVLLAFLLSVPATFCQQQPAAESSDSQFSVFGGYSYYKLTGNVNGTAVPDFSSGMAGQFIIRLNPWTGLLLDGNYNENSAASSYQFAGGFRVSHPLWRFMPFAEFEAGVQHVAPTGVSSRIAPTYIAGGGVDFRINKRFSVRPMEFAYVNSMYATSTSNGWSHLNGVRAQAGVVYNFGFPGNAGPIATVCLVEPATVREGEPVKMTVHATGLRPRSHPRYSYQSTGGKTTGAEDVVTVDTNGLDAAFYTITAKVESGSTRHPQVGTCTATFKVEAAAQSSWATQASSAAPSAEKAPEVTAPVKEAAPAEQAAPAKSAEEPAAPQPASKAKASRTEAAKKYGYISFRRDLKRPTRVDNEAKGQLDRFADALAASPDAKAVLVGFASTTDGDANSKTKAAAQRQNTAALRAVNTKQYLAKDKGIDPKRIEPCTGRGSGKSVELWLVAPGTVVPERGTAAVDEEKVQAVPRIPLRPRAHHAAVKAKAEQKKAPSAKAKPGAKPQGK